MKDAGDKLKGIEFEIYSFRIRILAESGTEWGQMMVSDINHDYDLIVIGGGIVGAGIARDASLRGLRTVLFEAKDIAWGTSSRSSKLVHGGIRYLETGDLRLVYQACIERKRLVDLAPHVVKPLPFIIPFYKGDPRGPFLVRLGTFLYDVLAGRHGIGRSKRLSVQQVLEYEPNINPHNLIGGVLYWDALMDDALLALFTAQSAAEAGAEIHTYSPVQEICAESGRVCGIRVKLDGEEKPCEFHARAIVNACGPWSDAVAKLESNSAAKIPLRQTKGVHIMVGPRTDKHALLLMSRRDRRIFFVIPYEGISMVGTTDTDYHGDAANVSVEKDDVDYLLSESARAFKQPIAESEIVYGFAGIRPLLQSDADSPSQASREHEIVVSPSGLVSVVGGKYTTYRAMAEEVVDLVVKKFGFDRAGVCKTRDLPLPGADELCMEEVSSTEDAIPVAAREHLQARYGTRSVVLEKMISEFGPEWLEPLVKQRPDLAVEVAYAKQHLWAKTPEDILRRRTTLEITGFVTDELQEKVAGLLEKI